MFSPSKQNIGNAGEYYIASYLSAKDFIATITLGRAERYDILALSPSGRSIKLSVKTRFSINSKEFPLSEKDEKGADKDFYYVFIKLNEFAEGKGVEFWIIPSERANHIISEAQKRWMNKKGKKDQPHNKTSIRELGVLVSESKRYLYPEGWVDELKKYYRNIEQLR